MAPPVGMLAILLAAGIGLGMAVYYMIHGRFPEQHQLQAAGPPAPPYRYRRRSPNRRPRGSPPPSPPNERRQLREILPPPAEEVLPEPENRIRQRPVAVGTCEICSTPMHNDTTELDCGHIFHEACINIYRPAILQLDPHGLHCVTCRLAA